MRLLVLIILNNLWPLNMHMHKIQLWTGVFYACFSKRSLCGSLLPIHPPHSECLDVWKLFLLRLVVSSPNWLLTSRFLLVQLSHSSLFTVQSIKEPFQNSWLNLQPNLDHLSVFLWLGFKVGASNGVYKVNISMYLKKKKWCDIMYTVRCTNFKSWPWNKWYQFHLKWRGFLSNDYSLA